MNRIVVAAIMAATLAISTGCATKKYVRSQTTPVVNKVNELDDLTAKTTKDIKDTDARATQGVQSAQSAANQADQHAQQAGQQAEQAQQLAMNANNGVNGLATRVANLDNYKPVTEASVHFGFNKAVLTKDARQQLDQLVSQAPNVKGYIISVEGNTDSVGSAQYNYELSQRRASAVIQYLASHNIPVHKIYVIGLGKDKPTAENKTAEGRKENRRVDIRLMTNTQGTQTAEQ
jgi:outer membrane protein OmpA-like peptidoglycan-associated protein